MGHYADDFHILAHTDHCSAMLCTIDILGYEGMQLHPPDDIRGMKTHPALHFEEVNMCLVCKRSGFNLVDGGCPAHIKENICGQ